MKNRIQDIGEIINIILYESSKVNHFRKLLNSFIGHNLIVSLKIRLSLTL